MSREDAIRKMLEPLHRFNWLTQVSFDQEFYNSVMMYVLINDNRFKLAW